MSRRPRHRWVATGIAMLLPVGLCGGCVKAHPDANPEPLALTAPPPPPRLLPPLSGRPIEPPTASSPPESGSEAAPPARRRADAPRAGDAGARQEPKTSELPKVETIESPPTESTIAPAPAEPAPVLQLAPSAESQASEQAIRQQLERATKDLSHVDYGALSADAKVQYDTAKRFMVLADQAMKDRNFIFARTLADKAAVIAGVLVSR